MRYLASTILSVLAFTAAACGPDQPVSRGPARQVATAADPLPITMAAESALLTSQSLPPAPDTSDVCPPPCLPDQQNLAPYGFAALIERFGTSERQVRATLGSPVSRTANRPGLEEDFPPGDSMITLQYNGLIVRFYSSAQQGEPLVEQLELSSAAFGRAGGVGVGSLQQDVEARFGPPRHYGSEGDGETRWSYAACPLTHIGTCPQRFHIVFRGGRVVRIRWEGRPE